MKQRKLDHEYIKELERMLLDLGTNEFFRCAECEYVRHAFAMDTELESEHQINVCNDCSSVARLHVREAEEDEKFIDYLYNNR